MTDELIQIQLGYICASIQRMSDKNFRYLWDYEFKIFSQWGEDGILNLLCDSLEIIKPNILEIGTEEAVECNSKFLALCRNANAYLVDPKLPDSNKLSTSGWNWKTHLATDNTFVDLDNIQEVYSKAASFLGNIDIISLDIDGVDYYIMEKLLERAAPRVIVCEYNSLFGHELAVTVPYDRHFNRELKHFSFLYYGASLKAFCLLMNRFNYTFIGSNRECSNAFFVKSDEVELVPIIKPINLELFTKSNFRESRDEGGQLNFLSNFRRFDAISQLNLVYLD